jgi:Phage integrase family
MVAGRGFEPLTFRLLACDAIQINQHVIGLCVSFCVSFFRHILRSDLSYEMTKTRNALVGKIINLRRGLAIYKVKASPYYRVRVWISSQRKRVVKTTRSTDRMEAIAIAEEFLNSLGTRGYLCEVPKSRTFQNFADKLLLNEKARGERGEISLRLWKVTKFYLEHKKWGVLRRFAKTDVGTIQTKHYHQYLEWVQDQDSSLTPATLNHIASTFNKVLKIARQEGAIENLPATPRVKRRDNPRSFFRFRPLVDRTNDEYQLLLKTAKVMANESARVRETIVTEELYDFILFMVHSFLRPTESEVYALTHRDVVIADNPKRLIINIKKGKTGHRIANTMPAAVSVYERIKKRNENRTNDDFLFLPAYKNRSNAKQIVQRQFNALLNRCSLKRDRYANTVHTVYSLRHTAICMRIILSEGRVDIFNLAKNAGTSVGQIERFYARNLPLSSEMARNLQSFAD